MGKAQSKLSPEQLSDLQKSTKCMLLNISDMQKSMQDGITKFKGIPRHKEIFMQKLT